MSTTGSRSVWPFRLRSTFIVLLSTAVLVFGYSCWHESRTPSLTLSGHRGPVNCVAFSPDESTIASAGDDECVRLWNIDGHETACLQGHSDAVVAVQYSSDGRHLMSISGNEIIIWDVASQRLVERIDSSGSRNNAVAISKDMQLVASADECEVRVDDLQRGVQILNINTAHRVSCMAFFNAGQELIVATEPNTPANQRMGSTPEVWHIADQRKTAELRGYNSWVRAIAVCPNHDIVAGDRSGRILRWTMRDGKAKIVWSFDYGDVCISVACSSNGGLVAVGGGLDSNPPMGLLQRRTISLIDAATGIKRFSYAYVGGIVTCLSFSSQSTRLAASSNDGSIRIWNIP